MKIEQFLLARIAEDEESAREFLNERNITWRGEYAHLSCSPGRFLAECESKRRIVQYLLQSYDINHGTNGDCGWSCSDDEHNGGMTAAEVVRLLALPYNTHPDFDPTWRQV